MAVEGRPELGRAFTFGVILDALVGVGPAFSVTVVPSTHEVFIAGGIGATVGHNISGGPLVGQNPSAVLPGLSFAAGYNINPLAGVQFTGNDSGMLAGPAMGIPGISASVTYAGCFSY